MDPSKFVKVPVPGDGGCFFHSISWLYRLNKLLDRGRRTNTKQVVSKISREDVIEKSKSYRDLAIDWMKENLDKWHHPEIELSLRQLIEIEVDEDPTINSVNDYLQKMRDFEEYAGNLEVTAMGNVLQTSIEILTIKNSKLVPVQNAKYTHPDSDEILYIYHNVGEGVSDGCRHYEPLFSVNSLLDFGKIHNLHETYIKKKSKTKSNEINSILTLNKIVSFGGKEPDQKRNHRYKLESSVKLKDFKKSIKKHMVTENDILIYNGNPLTELYDDFQLKDLGFLVGEGNESGWINDTITLMINGSVFSSSKKKTKRKSKKKSSKRKTKKKKNKTKKKKNKTKKKKNKTKRR